MKLGMVGLGKMGGNMAERLRRGGHEVVGYDAFAADKSDAASLADAVAAARRAGQPRSCWVMVPAGDADRPGRRPTSPALLGAGDLVIDGGNSPLHRLASAAARRWPSEGIGFIDCGTSGGVWGLDNGYCLMVGGAAEDVAKAQPIFDALAPEGGFAHVGPVGAGHYTKMVHNGIEYGMMQAFAEGVELLATQRARHRRRRRAVGRGGRAGRAVVAARPARRRARAQTPTSHEHRAAWPRTRARVAGRSTRRSASASPTPVIAGVAVRPLQSRRTSDNLADEGRSPRCADQFGGHAVEHRRRVDGTERCRPTHSRRARSCSAPPATSPRKKLFPAVYEMERSGTLDGVPVIGVSSSRVDRRRAARAGPGVGRPSG